ncbi:MAG: MarP family serine protease [Actinobacteria bacterium]|nr:MarP family serine protease [Actinomycetota bacterium]
MNFLDLLLLGLVGLAAFSGFRRGALLQLITYLGLFVGLVVGALLAPVLAGLAEAPFMQAAIALGTFLAIAGIGDAVGWFVGAKAWAAARGTRFQPVDAAGGSVVAIVALLLASWFVALNLAHGPFPTVSRQVRGSTIIRGLDGVLPEPPSVIRGVGRILDRFGFPEVFAGLPEAPGEPVDPPSAGQARRAFEAGADSTVKVVGRACDRIQEGSGFVAAEGYVVTNAHVVAGMDRPEVLDPAGGSQAATVVLFDPDLDLAILSVARTPGPVLSLQDGVVDRGATGVVIGYPQGGGLDWERAAVRRTLSAVGYDIYGRDKVVREIYELQAVVRPGNSGGPFVEPDGDVAGVVFAASTTDRDVGYALTSDQVQPIVDEATGRTGAVDTGPCLR